VRLAVLALHRSTNIVVAPLSSARQTTSGRSARPYL
jgi:hypothetical protein